MLNKLIIVSSLILCLMVSMAKSSPENNDELDSLIIQKLAAKVNTFEKIFYDSSEIRNPGFKENSIFLDKIIESLTSFAQNESGNNFADQAFIYLEKKKNMEIFHSFQNSLNQTETNYTGMEATIFDILQDTNKVSEAGKNLSTFMRHPVNINDLQNNFIDDHEAILNYFLLENNVFVYMLTHDSLQIVQWEIPIDSVKSLINVVMASFYSEIDLLHLEFNALASFHLYQFLFQPLEKYVQFYKIVYIIPDDFLIGFPFELLVTDTSTNGKYDKEIYYHRYSQLNFLIKKYAISYNYSTAIFSLTKELDRTTNKLGRRLLTMSEPIIQQDSDDQINQNSISLELEISDYTSDEIKRVSRLLFRHDNLKKEQAVKSYLFENGKTYRWLYFALPGILDNSNPLNSRVLFSREKLDSLYQPAWLTAREAMSTNSSADLLTLSASEVIEYGADGNPGILAMSQSFLFSGVKSILFSLWRINSISTSEFMSKFYWELKYKRQTNVQALREAKVASMKDTFIFEGKEISRAHPYFWATFQLVGDPKIRPPSPTKLPPWGLIIIVYVFVIAISVYITRKTLPDRK